VDGSGGTIDTVDSIRLERQFGPIEFIRRIKRDQLSILAPPIFERPLIYTKLLFLHSFLINRPEYIEQVLLTNAGNYVKSTFTQHILGPVLGKGLLLSEGEFWRRQRRIAAPAFHHKRVAGFVDAMVDAAVAMADRWRPGAAFDVAESMMAVTLEIIARTMFSADVSGAVADVRRLLDVVMDKGKPSLLDLFGLPQFLPRRFPRVYWRAIAEIDALIDGIIAPRLADGVDRGDLLSMLLMARDPETGEGMSPRQVRDEVATIMMAGHETTANLLAWTWAMLAQHPEVEARLHEEVDRVLGGRRPAFADLAALTYTRQVIEETMRLYPPAHTISRMAVAPDRFGAVPVPAGAAITISTYATHRNPRLWPDPERFDPGRFAPDQVARRHRFAYIPFGGGPRICIGNGFAMAEAQAIVASVAQRWSLKLAPGHALEPVGLITLRPAGGVWVTAAPRRAQGGDA
jgi:cytochrome P450